MAKRYAESHGLDLDETLTFNDLGVSAYRGKNVKAGALRAFLDAIEQGVVKEGSYLLVESLDRLSREAILRAQSIFVDIIESGITLVTLIDNREYSQRSINENPFELIMSLVSMMRAHDESATKSRRGKAAWENKRAKAKEKPLTAKAPAWFVLNKHNGTFEVDEPKAAVVRRIFEMTLNGTGQHTIAATLNREKVPVFGSGKHWHRSYIVKLLGNPAVIGRFIPHKMEYIDGKWKRKPQEAIEGYFPAILDRETYDQAQSLRLGSKAPLRGRHAGGNLRNIFGGLAKCPKCGSTMTLINKGRGNGKSYLVCTRAKAGAGCRYKTVLYENVEKAFLNDLSKIIGTVPAGDRGQGIDEQIKQLQNNIDGTEDHLGELLETLKGRASHAVANLIRETEDEIEKMKKQLNDLFERQATLTSEMVTKRLNELEQETNLDTLDRPKVNALLRQLFKGVTVDYLNGTIYYHWQHGGESETFFAWPVEEEAPKASIQH